jgi:hypothetical protein
MMKKLTKSQVIAKVKKLNEGEILPVTLFPSKCGPANTVWVQGYEVPLKLKNGVPTYETEVQEENFEDIINSYSYYNCNNELGKRVHFYINE